MRKEPINPSLAPARQDLTEVNKFAHGVEWIRVVAGFGCIGTQNVGQRGCMANLLFSPRQQG
jgi:hypothetical protein